MDPSSDRHEYCTGGFNPDDIVVSGMSGRFPECESVGELQEGLYQKKTLIHFSDERFEKGSMDIPYASCGLIKNLDKLDNEFFGVTAKNTNRMDPGVRRHIEVSYEAIADAGYDPQELRGLEIGVYNATTNDDSLRMRTTLPYGSEHKFPLHNIRAMNPNRTSFCLDLTGPSFAIDAACSSSSIAMSLALRDLQEGRVVGALVTGIQLNMSPDNHMGYFIAGIASLSGSCRPFDADADGMLRTEAIAALFIQKASTARRAYATLCESKFYTAGFVPEGISVPCGHKQVQIMQDTLKAVNLTPDDIDYVECHGTGTPVGDPIEVSSLEKTFCQGSRKKPLKIGCIKSNIGHTEATSGICGMIKAIFAFETGLVPPNICYDVPNPSATALVKGTIEVVTEPTPIDSPYIPVNSFGFGGTLVVSLLKKNPISYEGRQVASGSLPRLVFFPATTEEGVQYALDNIKKLSSEAHEEFYALLHNLSFTTTHQKAYRGYMLLTNDDKNTPSRIKNVVSSKRPLYYVMTGMGCQWSGMGLQLMDIEVFAQSMRRSAAVLKPYGIELFEILRADKNYLQVDRNITPAFVSIAAIQMALVDLLTFLGLSPDGIVGHSTGELICAYADGCCTLEETILSAYWRGKAVESSNLPSGAMAAVGLSWKDAQKLCPKGIFPACDNADDSVTISGLKEPLEKFVAKLTAEKIFARVVNAYGYAFHSEYVHPAASALREALSKFIKNPKPRTDRWLSTSYPESEWDTPSCKIANADYFVHNLMSSVRFNDALKKIPSDAIVVEIGPHFLLQSILKRVIGKDASYIGLMKRNEPNNIKFLMESLGTLYTEGLDVRVDRLYPPVKFPVPRGTPVISNLFKWNYSQSFYTVKFTPPSSEYSKAVNVERADAYLLDHHIDGRSLFPATGYVYLAWEALATKYSRNAVDTPVVVENLVIHRATILGQNPNLTFNVSILDGSGSFEITESKALVASGNVSLCKNMNYEVPDIPVYSCDDYSAVSGEDIYNELKMGGYEYGPEFQGLLETNMGGTAGLVLWKNKWISYMDSLLLFFGLINKGRDFFLPTGALSFKIDPNALKEYVQKASEGTSDSIPQKFPVSFNPNTRICRSVGIEISNLNVDVAPHRGKEGTPTLEDYKFVPYFSKYLTNRSTTIDFNNYMALLNQSVVNLEKASGKNASQFKFSVEGNDELSDFLDDLSEEHVLLSVFHKLGDKSSRIKEFFQLYKSSCGKDMLNSALLNEESLRILYEIVDENTHRKLNVVEVARDFPTILIPLIEMLKKFSHSKLKKSTLVTKSFAGDKSTLEDYNIHLQAEDTLSSLEKERNQDVVISSFTTGSVSDLQNLLRSLISIVKPTGFILFFHKESLNPAERYLSLLSGEELQIQNSAILEQSLQNLGLTTLSKISDSFGSSAYLLRVVLPPLPHSIVNVEESSYGWVEELKKEMYGSGKENKKDPIWVIAEDSPVNGIVGMVNCIKQEPGGERVRCIFISENVKNGKIPPLDFNHPFYKHLKEKNLVMNVWKNGAWGSYRHVMKQSGKQLKTVEHSYINLKKFGDLSTFEWIESSVKHVEEKNKVIVHNYYSALNFKDVMLATGKLSISTTKDNSSSRADDSVLGFEFSGRDSSGKRVCGMTMGLGMATSNLTDPLFLIPVPDSWSLEDAATVPVVYSTCYYALILRAKLRKGERVLIHSGTGGIGLAAIRIALSQNCEIFTTVGNDEKRKYLKGVFPQIKDENIGCSRNTSFYSMVMNGTNGKGVNVILNSLADDKFKTSLRCMAKGGRFVEIGKYDLSLDRKIGLKMFLKNISFHAVFLDELFDGEPSSNDDLRAIQTLVQDGIKTGVVKPLDRTVFGRNDVEEAFRYMAKGIHVGKVLLKIRDEEGTKTAIPKTLMLPAVPNTYFYNNKVYIIIGGIGGFGIEVTKWIISRGGRHIILTSRYGERTPYHYLCLKRWKDAGADVHVSTLNVEHKGEAEKLLKEAEKMGRVGGIFNSAVVLKDAFMDCQTAESYREVCAPKATASKNLDELSRKLCPALDYFVCFSSISCGRGNAGQTNYGYANSVMERICEERRKDGLHGLAIQWGIIGEVGVVHRHMGDDAMIAGVMAQSVKSCLDTLDVFCQQSEPVVCSYVTASASKKSGTVDVISQLIKILGSNDISEINVNKNFSDMGMDSMVGVEMKQLIESYCDISITLQEIQEMKIGDVKALFAKADSETKHSSAKPALMATTTIKLPSTLTHTEPLVLLNKTASGTPIFIINIGDTDVKDFETLAQTVGRPVYGLVWTKDAPTTDMKSLASWYLNLIVKTVSGPFHVIGHSLGGSVAFEIALQGDKNLKTVMLIDGSSNLLNNMTNEDSDCKDPELKALCSFVSQFVAPGGATLLEEQLEKSPGLEQRIKIVLKFLSSSSNQTISNSELADVISSYLVKYGLVQSYAPTDKLSRDINLLEDPTVLLANDVTIIKEQFEQICKGKVNIHRVFQYSQLSNKEDVEKLAAVLQSII